MAELTLRLKGRELKRFVLGEKRIMVGRAPGCDVAIDNIAVSREHAKIEYSDGQYVLSDLGSSNGTFRNENRITETVSLHSGDLIQIGKFELLFEDSLPDEFSLDDSGSVDKTMIMSSGQKQPAHAEPGQDAWRKLAVVSGKANRKEIFLKKDVTAIGKARDCDLVLAGLFVAKVQAVVRKKGDQYYLIDKGSIVSTKLNGRKFQGETLLKEGDSIQIRKIQLFFC